MNLCNNSYWKHRNLVSIITLFLTSLSALIGSSSHHCVTLATNSAASTNYYKYFSPTSAKIHPNRCILKETAAFYDKDIMATEEKKDPDTIMAKAEDIDSDEEAANAFLAQLDEASASNKDLGKGWSSGKHDPTMFPLTRDGRLQLYSANRRWIGLNKGWSRVGAEGTNQFSHRTRRSSQMKSLIAVGANASAEERQKMLEAEALGCRSLIAQLCEQYYQFGWATGTAGGVSIRVGGPSENRPWRVFVAPSGIQKGELKQLYK